MITLKLNNFSKITIVAIILFFNQTSCKETTTVETVPSIHTNLNDSIPIYNFDELEPLLYTTSSKTYVINFWAMWCVPCVQEMPYFQEYANKNPDIELIFVSMDFVKDIETTLKPFLKEKNITSQVVLLDDPDANTWIDKIDPNWSGAIPFTIIFNNKKRAFFEQDFDNIEELESAVNKTINS